MKCSLGISDFLEEISSLSNSVVFHCVFALIAEEGFLYLSLLFFGTLHYDLSNNCKMGFPGGSNGKESACSPVDPGSNPGSGRSPGEGNGYPLQYSCLEKSMDRGAWGATAHGVANSGTQPSD